MPERKPDEQIRVESLAAVYTAQLKLPIRDRIARLLRDADTSLALDGLAEEIGTDKGCGGTWTSDPPCGGCCDCLAMQVLHYMPDHEHYLALADQALAVGQQRYGNQP